VFAAVILGLGVSTAHAQEMMRVNVPFAFVVGHHQFAAGQYEIREIDGTANVLAIEGISDPSSFGFVLTNAAYGKDPAGDQPTLVFTHDENQYRLTQVWDSTTEGRELMSR
jgi:hypothetical protein